VRKTAKLLQNALTVFIDIYKTKKNIQTKKNKIFITIIFGLSFYALTVFKWAVFF